MILTMAPRSSDLPAAARHLGDAAINTWYRVLSKILRIFNGVAALIFVARLGGKLQSKKKPGEYIKIHIT